MKVGNIPGLKGSFSQEEYVELHLYKEECSRMMLDGICASEGADVPYAVFIDFSGLSLTDLMGFLDYGKAMIQLKGGKCIQVPLRSTVLRRSAYANANSFSLVVSLSLTLQTYSALFKERRLSL